MTCVAGKIERVRPQQFHETVGLADWRVLGEGACAYFRAGSLAVGARLVQAIGELPDVGAGHPDIDVRYDGVTVRLITLTEDFYGLSERDVQLARQISAVARTLTIPADPSAVQTVQVTVDALAGPDVVRFLACAARLCRSGEEPGGSDRPEGNEACIGTAGWTGPEPARP